MNNGDLNEIINESYYSPHFINEFKIDELKIEQSQDEMFEEFKKIGASISFKKYGIVEVSPIPLQ